MVEECEQEGAEGAGGEQGGGRDGSCKDGCGQKAGEAEVRAGARMPAQGLVRDSQCSMRGS